MVWHYVDQSISSPTQNCPTGWSFVRQDQSTSANVQSILCYRVASSEPASYTFTGGHAGEACGVTTYAGAVGVGAVAGTNDFGTAGNTLTAPPITTTGANSMLLVDFGWSAGTNQALTMTFTTAFNVTNTQATPNAGVAQEYVPIPFSGTYTNNINAGTSGNVNWAAEQIELLATGPTPTVTPTPTTTSTPTVTATPTPVPNPVCNVGGNVLKINGSPAISQRVVFDTYSLQNQGGSLTPAGKFSVNTDAFGNLPNPTNVPEGLVVFLTVGSGQPVRIQIPNATSANLSQLVAANNGPASLVTGVAATGPGSSGISITNPPLGGIGISTINFNGTAIPGVNPGTTGQILIQGPLDPAFYTLTGDISCSTAVPGLCTVVGFQGTPISATPPVTGDTWVFNGTQWVPSLPSNNAINVVTLGAKGDCVTNDQPAFDLAAAMRLPGQEVDVPTPPGGCYVVPNTNWPTNGKLQCGSWVSPNWGAHFGETTTPFAPAVTTTTGSNTLGGTNFSVTVILSTGFKANASIPIVFAGTGQKIFCGGAPTAGQLNNCNGGTGVIPANTSLFQSDVEGTVIYSTNTYGINNRFGCSPNGATPGSCQEGGDIEGCYFLGSGTDASSVNVTSLIQASTGGDRTTTATVASPLPVSSGALPIVIAGVGTTVNGNAGANACTPTALSESAGSTTLSLTTSLPSAIVNVASTTGFLTGSSMPIYIATLASFGTDPIYCTGVTSGAACTGGSGNCFTGCTGGTGQVLATAAVTQPNIVTATCSAPHGLLAGDQIISAGNTPSGYNSPAGNGWIVNTEDSTHITWISQNTGLGAGSGFGTIKDGNYNRTVLAKVVDSTHLTFPMGPFSDMGTGTGGTITPTTECLAIGDSTPGVSGGWAYQSGLNTDHVGAGNCGIGVSVFEQNATHRKMSIQGTHTCFYFDAPTNGTGGYDNDLTFDTLTCAGVGHIGVDAFNGMINGQIKGLDVEMVNATDPTAMMVAISGAQSESINNSYLEAVSNGTPVAFVGDAVVVRNYDATVGLNLDNDSILFNNGSHTDFHLIGGGLASAGFGGARITINHDQAYNNTVIEPGIFYSDIDATNLSNIFNNAPVTNGNKITYNGSQITPLAIGPAGIEPGQFVNGENLDLEQFASGNVMVTGQCLGSPGSFLRLYTPSFATPFNVDCDGGVASNKGFFGNGVTSGSFWIEPLAIAGATVIRPPSFSGPMAVLYQGVIGSAPACNSTNESQEGVATDCNATCANGATCTTGGSTHCPIYCNGSVWVEQGGSTALGNYLLNGSANTQSGAGIDMFDGYALATPTGQFIRLQDSTHTNTKFNIDYNGNLAATTLQIETGAYAFIAPAVAPVIGQVPVATSTANAPPVAAWTSLPATHALTGTTPVGVCNSATAPWVDVQTFANTASPTLMTLPCACASGEIMTWHIHQTSSGGTITLPSGTIGPFSTQNGSCTVVGVGTNCTLGVTQSPPSDLDANFQLDGTVWRLETCNPF
jgi:hypothetical protein